MRKKYLFFKIMLVLAVLVSLVPQLNIPAASAFNNDSATGNKPFHFIGYRYKDSKNIQVWFDKGLPSSNVSPEQFKIFKGTDSSGQLLTVTAATPGLSSDKNMSVTGLPNGSSYILTIGSENSFESGQSYTVIISRTLKANNGLVIGGFTNNKDVRFTFTAPSGDGTYTAASGQREADYWIEDGASGVPVEGNLWFSLPVPAVNYDEVKNGIVLKENGTALPYDPTIDASAVDGARSFSPEMSNDHTYFFIPLTGSGGAVSYDLALNSTYMLEIPAIQLVNGQQIPAKTLHFTTASADVPLTMTSAVTTSTQDGAFTLQWSALSFATGYNIYYSSNPYWDFQKLNAVPTVGTSYSVTGLTPGQTYYFRVAGVTAGGEGGLSPAVAAVIPQLAIPQWIGGSLAAQDIGKTGLTLKWSGAVDDVAVTGYNVYQDGVLLTPATVSGDTYQVSGLSPSATYLFKVQAVDGDAHESMDGPSVTVTTTSEDGGTPGSSTGGSGSTGGTGGTGGSGGTGGTGGGAADTIPPVFPSGSVLTADKTAQMEADVQWTAATDNVGVAGYRIYIDGNSSPAYSVGNVTSFHAAGLPTGPHTLTVQAFDAAGNLSTGGPSGQLGGDSDKTFTVSMSVISKEPTRTVLQFDFNSGIDFNLNDALQKIKLTKKGSGQAIAFSSQNYLKQGTDWDTSVQKLRRLTLTYNNLENDTAYTVTAASGLTANNGNTLGHDYSWDFAIGTPPVAVGGGGGGAGSGASDSGEEELLQNAIAPEQAGVITARPDRTILLKLDAGKAGEAVADSSRAALAINLASLWTGQAIAVGIEIPKELTAKLKKAGKPVILQDGTLYWRIPESSLPDDADTTLVLSYPALSNLSPKPDYLNIEKAYSFSVQADGVKTKLSGTQTTVSLPASESRLQGLYQLNDQGSAWNYVSGKKSNSRLTLKVGESGTYLLGTWNRTFADTGSHWAKENIDIMAARQIVTGVDSSRFSPNAKVTRAEFAAMLYRMLKLDNSGSEASFTDVDNRAWYASAVAGTAAVGLIQGEGGRFNPDRPITRQEMAVMIDRACTAAKLQTAAADASFKDKGEIAAWATGSVNRIYGLGLITGRQDNRFEPAEPATRAEAATMLLKLMDKME